MSATKFHIHTKHQAKFIYIYIYTHTHTHTGILFIFLKSTEHRPDTQLKLLTIPNVRHAWWRIGAKDDQRHLHFQHSADAHQNWSSPARRASSRLRECQHRHPLPPAVRDGWQETLQHLQTACKGAAELTVLGQCMCKATHTHTHINDLPILHPFVRFLCFVRIMHTQWFLNDPALKICRHRYVKTPDLVLRDVKWRKTEHREGLRQLSR